MTGKLKLFFILGVVIALGCFTTFVLIGTREQSLTVKQLPDGTVLRLGAVLFTNGNLSFTSLGVVGWRAKIAAILPDGLKQRLGWSAGGGTLTMGSAGSGTNLGVFTVAENSTYNGFQDLRLVVSDGLGNSYAAGDGGEMNTSSGKTHFQINGWTAWTFPRRSETLDLQIYKLEFGAQQDHLITEFSVPNPAAGIYPIWTPESLPATRTNQGLSITLKKIQSGMIGSSIFDPVSRGTTFNQAFFRVSQARDDVSAWRPIGVEISDATGNRWIPNSPSSDHYRDIDVLPADFDVLSFKGALWPGESAWKLRFEFSRIADFDADELFTFNGIEVPDATQVITLDNTTNLAGSSFQLLAICGAEAEPPASLKWSTAKERMTISVRIDPLPDDRHLTLVRVTDETGREARLTPLLEWKSPEKAYAFQPPTGARHLNFTFAFHKSRFAEFVVKPEFPFTN